MLRYAKKNYIRLTSKDNNMRDWFEGIKDFDKYAKWLNKNSLSVAPTLFGITKINENKKD